LQKTAIVYSAYVRVQTRLYDSDRELYDRWNLRIASPNRATRRASKNTRAYISDIDLPALRGRRAPSRTHWCLGRPRGRGPRWYGPRTASSASVKACPGASASPGTAKLRIACERRRPSTRAKVCDVRAYTRGARTYSWSLRTSRAIACARLKNRARTRPALRALTGRVRALNGNVNKTAPRDVYVCACVSVWMHFRFVIYPGHFVLLLPGSTWGLKGKGGERGR